MAKLRGAECRDPRRCFRADDEESEPISRHAPPIGRGDKLWLWVLLFASPASADMAPSRTSRIRNNRPNGGEARRRNRGSRRGTGKRPWAWSRFVDVRKRRR